MKQKFIPLEKQSKRKQKEWHAAQRKDWGNFSPVTRKVENGKGYNRKKSKLGLREYEPGLDFLFSGIIVTHPIYTETGAKGGFAFRRVV